MRRRSSTTGSAWVLCFAALAPAFGCSADFDTTRQLPKRGTIGRELYGLVCDRVGAQALREDVTGASFRGICHPDAQGAYVDKVDAAQLWPIIGDETNEDGVPVPVEQQKKNRAVRVARVETLGKNRERLVAAFDAMLPDDRIPVRDLGHPDPKQSCSPRATADGPDERYLTELAATLSRMVDLYNDQTIPMFTRALGRMMNDIKVDPETQQALARVDARKGYRPSSIAVGVARPVLTYDRLFELANSLLKLIATDSDPYNPSAKLDPSKATLVNNRKPLPGKAAVEFQATLSALHEELRTASPDPPPPPLAIAADPILDGASILSRPRTTLELGRKLMLIEDGAFARATPRYLVARDVRGYAAIPLASGKVPSPFVDLTGPAGTPDGLPDVDELGRFLTSNGQTAPTPFFVPGEAEARRDSFGRATFGTGTTPIYTYIDTSKTFVSSMLRDLRPLIDPDPKKGGHEAVMSVLGALPVLAGIRDAKADAKKQYPPDPSRVEAYRLAHPNEEPPQGLASQPVTLSYRAFHPEESPIVDMLFALGQIITDPALDDGLTIFRELLTKHPTEVARLIGMGLRMKAIADKHPEATIAEKSAFWDEILDVAVDAVQTPDFMERLFIGFSDPRTLKLEQVFTTYMQYKDALSYQRDPSDVANETKFNGLPLDLTTGKVEDANVPVDRTKPDSGENRSQLQRFAQLLHDANGLGACTKAGAVAHIKVHWPTSSGIPVAVDYPSSVTKALCTSINADIVDPIPLCGILRFENVAQLIIKVAVNKMTFDVRDPCLNKIVHNDMLTGVVGGADAFLEETSGIKGFSLHPTVNGVSRLAFFDTPYPAGTFSADPAGRPADIFYPKTSAFLTDLIDPIPSMVCPETPFTDPSDGKVIHLRKCASFKDTLRGRDGNDLFALETMSFIANVQPLALAFYNDDPKLDRTDLFVRLFDTMHLHWGTPKQTRQECDPTLPRSDFRWCSQDGLVAYEPLLVELLKADLFPTMKALVDVLKQTVIKHCDTYDPKTHACTQTSERDGLQVMAEMVRVLVDPKRNAGLVDRKGNGFALRNDGTKFTQNGTPYTTPLLLFIDALKKMDKTFADFNAANPTDNARQIAWKQARSDLVDTFLTVDGQGDQSKLKNQAILRILPEVMDVARAQVYAHCPDRTPGAQCAWARTELVKSVSDALKGPSAAAAIDLLDAIRRDDAARQEIERLALHLIDTSNDETIAITMTALIDFLQVLGDDTNLVPIFRLGANAATGSVAKDDGTIVQRGLVDASIAVLARLFATAQDEQGTRICAREIDPNRSIEHALQRIVVPIAANDQSPIEVILGVIGDVNRADPSSTAKLEGRDYANMSNEISEFLLHKSRGLEQIYEVLRQATKPE